MLGSSRLWIYGHLNGSFLSFLTVDLVMHPEEGRNGKHIGQHEVSALDQLKKARIVRAECLEFDIVACNGEVEASPQEVGRSKDKHDDAKAFLLRLQGRAPLDVHEIVQLLQVAHHADEKDDGCVQDTGVESKEGSLLQEEGPNAEEAVPS